MTTRFWLSSLLGAVIVYACVAISWMALPYHNQSINRFTDPAEVVSAIKANVPKSGVYMYPTTDQSHREESAAAKAEQAAGIAKQFKEGPIIFATVSLQGHEGMLKNLIIEFLTGLALVLLLNTLMLYVRPSNYFCRLSFVAVFALACAVSGALPYWNWWNFSTYFTLLSFADRVVGLFLAGVVMLLINKPATQAC